MEVIKVNQVTKIYNPSTIPVHALNGIDLSIQQGEFTAIVGPSGSGKTTLLNLIGGLDNPSSGQVHINKHNITNMSDNKLIDFRREYIGFVFQAYNLLPVLTTAENIEFVMLLKGSSATERHQRTLELLQEVGLTDKANNRPSQLSGGQQQRVAVARALASKPAFILADEPTANLDSQTTTELLDMMLRLNQKENMTFVFSTHDQRVIDRARRIITIEDGRLISDKLQTIKKS